MTYVNLKKQFEQLFNLYSEDLNLQKELWSELEKSYSHRSRKYHNLAHVEAMLKDLDVIKDELKDWNSVQFSVFYHDIYYISTSKNNEEQSAKIARQSLQKIGLPATQIAHIEAQILATKKHQIAPDMDTNFLLDADLAILGRLWEQYTSYMNNVREEYKIYPDILYRPGRKKVLNHFLALHSIYKTPHFHNRLELKAKENLQRELDLL